MAFGACAADTPEHPGLVVRDSAGVRIVENTGPLWEDEGGWRLGDHPLVEIGGGDAEEDQLFRVVAAFRFTDGRIAVANAGSYEVRVFDRQGRLLHVVGGEGEGPGEFRSLYGMYQLGADSVAVHDTRLQRITVFRPEGTFVRSFTTTRPDGATRIVPAGPMGDAGWLMMFGQQIGPALGTGYVRLNLYLAQYDQAGFLLDTVAVVPGFEIFIHETAQGRVVPTIPFGRGAGVATREGEFLVAINDSYEIRAYDRTGKLRTIVRRLGQPRPVNADDLDAARAAQLELFQNSPLRIVMADAHEHMPIPTTMPAFGRPASERVPWIVSDPAGGFWVVEYSGPANMSERWSAFDHNGRFLGTLLLPEGFALYEVGEDYVLGVWRDADDVEHVRMYELVKP